MFSNSIRIARFAEIDVRIDASWLFIAALITWSLSAEYFPSLLPDETQATYLAMGVAAATGFFLSLLLHEFAHALVARHFGLEINRITLFLFGGVAEMESEPKTAPAELYMAIAGPIMSLALGLGFWSLSAIAPLFGSHPAVSETLGYLGAANLVLAIFNMLPAFPLDGGRVLRAYLWARSGNLLKATEIAARAGATLGYALMALGVLLMVSGLVIAGLWQLFIGGFLLFAAKAAYRHALFQHDFGDVRVSALMTRAPVTVTPDLSLHRLAQDVMLARSLSFVPVVDQGVLLGHVDGRMLRSIDRENWADLTVGDIFVSLNDSPRAEHDDNVLDLMDRIQSTGQRKFLVTEGKKLVGIISLSDLTRHLAVSSMVRA